MFKSPQFINSRLCFFFFVSLRLSSLKINSNVHMNMEHGTLNAHMDNFNVFCPTFISRFHFHFPLQFFRWFVVHTLPWTILCWVECAFFVVAQAQTFRWIQTTVHLVHTRNVNEKKKTKHRHTSNTRNCCSVEYNIGTDERCSCALLI